MIDYQVFRCGRRRSEVLILQNLVFPFSCLITENISSAQNRKRGARVQKARRVIAEGKTSIRNYKRLSRM